MGQLPPGSVSLVESAADVAALEPRDAERLAFITQTTLSLEDTAEIVAALRERFPMAAGPRKKDICYATANRQEAVKALAARCPLVLVIGAPNSSNSVRLVEVALRAGAGAAQLIGSADEVDWDAVARAGTVGVTAGASAPEDLVEALVAEARARFDAAVEEVAVTREDVVFKLPRAVAS
jgi:4-hydroxy-3-methylbut-2-enyl diphosphate reductase